MAAIDTGGQGSASRPPKIANASSPASEADSIKALLEVLKQIHQNQVQRTDVQPNQYAELVQEIRQIRCLQEQMIRLAEPINPQAFQTFMLQVFGIVAAIVFGAFAILAWTVAKQANDLTSTANPFASQGLNESKAQNQFALAAYCSGRNESVCSTVESVAAASLTPYAQTYFGILPGGSGSTNDSSGLPPTQAGQADSTMLAGIVIGAVAAIALLSAFLYVTLASFRARKERGAAIRRTLEKMS